MSKVLKSTCIEIGTPKPLSYITKTEIKSEVKSAGDEEAGEAAKAESEEIANSIIDDAKQMYLKIIEEANSEAQAILEAANTEAEKLYAEARENGYREGFQNGYQEGSNESQSIIDEAAEIREFLDERKLELYSESETEVLQLVIEISEKVIGEELAQNKDAVLSLVRQALQKCAFRKKLILKISPVDYDYIIENKDRICMMVEGISDIDIVSELSLAKGSCIVETPSGEINSGIDVQLKEIENIFAYLLRNE